MNVPKRILQGRFIDLIVYHRLSRTCQTGVNTVTSSVRKQKSRRQYASRLLFFGTGELKPESTKESPELFQYYNLCHRCHTGIYHYLPMAQRSLEKLVRVIDEEMADIGAHKVSLSSLAPAALWKKTGRWETNELFKLSDRLGKQFCLCPTHEEVITSMVASRSHHMNHNQLPLMLYQITRKFRDEMHPRYAFLRGREFEMKDLYTFDKSDKDARQTYETICDSYHNIFTRLGLPYTKVAGHTGNIGGDLSHEFHLSAPIGEDVICTCQTCGLTTNLELIAAEHQDDEKLGCTRPDCTMVKSPGIEVGHAFLLGTKYSAPFEATCRDTEDNGHPSLEMGCYGLGVSRLLQSSVEVLRDGANIVWPSIIAPYQVMIIPQKEGYLGAEFKELSDELSDRLTSMPNMRGEVVIHDKTQKTVGGRLRPTKAHGFPYAIVVNRKTVESQLYEVMNLVTHEKEDLSLDQVMDKFSKVETI